jgi:hypothetical protein
MRLDLSRILSLVVAAGYLAAATISLGGEGVLRTALFLIFPLSGIWFSAQLGAYTGGMGRHVITQKSPGGAVALVCWILLLVPAIGYVISLLS